MAIIQDIENSAYIQALKKEFADAQAAGASQEQLLNIHQKAQDYRQAAGYTADLSGSTFTVIDTYEPVSQPQTVQQINTNKITADSNGATIAGDLRIENGNISKYLKFGLVGLIGLAVLDTVLGRRK